MTSKNKLSWDEDSLSAKLQLFVEERKDMQKKKKSNDPKICAKGYFALSSTYYTIAGTAFFHLKESLKPKQVLRLVGWSLTWPPLALWCYGRMLPLSNKGFALVGYEGMTANECDSRQSTLRRRRKFEEAKECILEGLRKNPEHVFTPALLRLGLADIYRREGDREEVVELLREVLRGMDVVEREEPAQASRIYRHCADLVEFLEKGEGPELEEDIPAVYGLLLKAQQLAESSGAKDQLLKGGFSRMKS